ncbi:Palmitoleoyl-protein carboxylesterase NOTUM [Diplonema papillatum]|nr:Palmitoleoyl-protein carboxylesterase NOTUM [Diplonema papillatum]|eukprot:gene13488-20782_t
MARRYLGRLCVCLAGLSLAGAAPTTLALMHVDQARFPLAKCNDGTAAAYYIKEADTKAATLGWIVHLQGGGWCWDDGTCTSRAKSSPQLTTSKLWNPTMSVEGIFDDESANSPVFNYTKVYVPYCSSDAHMGWRLPLKGGLNATDPTTWYFMGQEIVRAVLDTLVQDYRMGLTPQRKDQFLLSGCSAGGRGAMAHTEYLSEYLKVPLASGNDFEIQGSVLDSPLYVNVQPLNPAQVSLMNQSVLTLSYSNTTGVIKGSTCDAMYPDPLDKWKCTFGEYRIPAMLASTAKFMVNAAQWDAYQMSVDIGSVNPSAMTQTQRDYANNPFRATMRSVVARNVTRNIISTPCLKHCTSEEIQFYNMTVNGPGSPSFAQVLSYFLTSPPPENPQNHWLGDCTSGGIGCGSGCCPIDAPF